MIGVMGPLLWVVMVIVQVKGTPVCAVGAQSMLSTVTLASDLSNTSIVWVPEPPLLSSSGSRRCTAFCRAIDPVALKVWKLRREQLTVQVLAITIVLLLSSDSPS